MCRNFMFLMFFCSTALDEAVNQSPAINSTERPSSAENGGFDTQYWDQEAEQEDQTRRRQEVAERERQSQTQRTETSRAREEPESSDSQQEEERKY